MRHCLHSKVQQNFSPLPFERDAVCRAAHAAPHARPPVPPAAPRAPSTTAGGHGACEAAEIQCALRLEAAVARAIAVSGLG
jgi:hypothetical protein